MKKLLLILTLSSCLISASRAQTVPAYVPTNGLVGYWGFDGDANDYSGNGNHGTVYGAKLITNRFGNSGKAYRFNANEAIEVNISNEYSPAKTKLYSISFWTSVDSSFQQSKMLIAYNIGVGFNNYDIFSSHSGCGPNTISFQHYPYNNPSACSPSNINLNNWYHIVAIFDANLGQGKIYKNGEHWFDGQISNSAPGEGKLNFGNNGNNGGFGLFGRLDDIGVWNRALTLEEISALYNANSSAIVSVEAAASVKQNDTLEISINTSELKSSEDIISYQTKLSYDTTRLSYLSHSLNGSIINGGSTLVNANTNGLLKISHMNSAAITGAGSLIKLKFLANSKLGQAAFAMSNFLFNTSAVNQLINDTTEIIDGVPPTAKISLSAINLRKGDSLIITATFNEKMASSPLPQLSISGANNLANTNMTMINDSLYTYTHLVEKGDGAASIKLHTGTDLAGNLVVENPTEGQNFNILPTVYGDIDTNKFIQAYDAALALKYSVNLNPIPNIDSLPWSNWRKVVSNVDTVGGITANDASLILQYSAELIKSFPADASLRGLGNSTAEVIISKEADKLVFRAKGNLFGFNLYVKENFAALGKPTVLDNNMIVATNINDQNYAIGLATAYAPAEEAVFMTIPLTANAPANLLFDMIINTENAQQSISTISGIFENKAKGLNIFPNPTKDVLNINQAIGYTLRIVDFSGKEVFNQLVNNNKYEVSLKQLGSKGVYLITLSNENQQLISSQKIVLE